MLFRINLMTDATINVRLQPPTVEYHLSHCHKAVDADEYEMWTCEGWTQDNASENLLPLQSFDVIRQRFHRSAKRHRLRLRLRQRRLPVQPDALRHRDGHRSDLRSALHLGSASGQERPAEGM